MEGDAATLAYYGRHARELLHRDEAQRSGLEALFERAFSPNARVVDIGSGTGRHLVLLLAAGYQAIGLEPVAALREQCLARHPALRGCLFDGALPSAVPSAESLGGLFDGALCFAVLQHLPESQLGDAIRTVRACLRPPGRVLVSVPVARFDVGPTGRDAGGRLFSSVRPETLVAAFEANGFRLSERFEVPDGLGRPGNRWQALILELE